MIGLLIAVAATTMTPHIQRLADINMAIGVCETHMTNEQLAQFDPYGNDLPRRVQDALSRSREAGRQEGRRLRLSYDECEELIAAVARKDRP